MKKVLVLIAVLAMATSAQAVLVVGNAGGVIDVQITPLGTMLTPGGSMVDMYNVTLVAPNPADSVSAVDVDIIPGSSLLYQDWFMGFVQSPECITMAGPAAAYDSHFNVTAAGPTPQNWIAGVRLASENNDLSIVPPSGPEGFGITLDVASGVTPILQACDLANVVVLAGGSAVLTGTCSDGVGEVFTFGPLHAGGIVIPEPATIGLLILGGMGLLARKRR